MPEIVLTADGLPVVFASLATDGVLSFWSDVVRPGGLVAGEPLSDQQIAEVTRRCPTPQRLAAELAAAQIVAANLVAAADYAQRVRELEEMIDALAAELQLEADHAARLEAQLAGASREPAAKARTANRRMPAAA
ncbi:MAG: hypothetical protein ABSG43_00330 [Solirubrobacteraceae bacterium]|jgi:hypothetical protein